MHEFHDYHFLQCQRAVIIVNDCEFQSQLTGWPVLTTPCRVRMLGCLNWAMMAASWRNLTVLAESVRIFTATVSCFRPFLHSASLTLPNSPDPRWEIILCEEHSMHLTALCFGTCCILPKLSSRDNFYIVRADLSIESAFFLSWFFVQCDIFMGLPI